MGTVIIRGTSRHFACRLGTNRTRFGDCHDDAWPMEPARSEKSACASRVDRGLQRARSDESVDRRSKESRQHSCRQCGRTRSLPRCETPLRRPYCQLPIAAAYLFREGRQAAGALLLAWSADEHEVASALHRGIGRKIACCRFCMPKTGTHRSVTPSNAAGAPLDRQTFGGGVSGTELRYRRATPLWSYWSIMASSVLPSSSS